MRTKILILISSLLTISCGKNEIKFNELTWNERDDMFYKNRELMVNDLMENQLHKGMKYKELLEMLGNPENHENLKPNTIAYEIMVDYGSDIDPVEGKDLYMIFNKDSTLIDFKLKHWKH
jgi:hypothetical protein